jgi:hypothetical protein
VLAFAKYVVRGVGDQAMPAAGNQRVNECLPLSAGWVPVESLIETRVVL